MTRLTYEDLTKKVGANPNEPLAPLAEHHGIVYVYALTRDRCAGCQAQKPLFEKLVHAVDERHRDKVRFANIHVSEDRNFQAKLQDFRRLLKFAAYPTYLIFIRAEVGVVEIYRGIEPPMEEISRNIDIGVELENR